MAERKTKFLTKIIIDLAVIGFSFYKFIPNFLLALELETAAIKKAVLNLIVLYLTMGILLASIWFCLMGMIYFFLTSQHLSSIFALFIIGILNLLLLITVAFIIQKTKNNLSLSRISRVLRSVF